MTNPGFEFKNSFSLNKKCCFRDQMSSKMLYFKIYVYYFNHLLNRLINSFIQPHIIDYLIFVTHQALEPKRHCIDPKERKLEKIIPIYHIRRWPVNKYKKI